MKFLSLLIFMSLSFQTLAQDDKMKEVMKAMEEYSTPGPEHKKLAEMSGRWTYIMRSWAKADMKPEESKGTSKMTMVLGGKFLQHETKTKAMGKPYTGLGFTGYNNATKKYETIWLDSMGTGMMVGLEGTYDENAKTYKDQGEFTCPMKSNAKAEYRNEWKIVDKNNMVFTMYGPEMGSDKEIKMMEMIYKRAK